jgi:pyrimidine-specific ribonucleoside hydrolase
MQRLVFDMETGDPDDVLTLILLLGHPGVDLRAVTVTPGTPHQIGIVRHILRGFGREDMPVGAFNLHHMKARGTPDEHYVTCVSPWHYKWMGDVPLSKDAEPGWAVLHAHLGHDTMLLTGAPLKNLGEALRRGPPEPFAWVAQGGFAGDGVVPEGQQLDKFRGLRTCPTYNFNGDPKSALLAMEHDAITSRRFISKNICHGVVYDQKMHDRLAQFLMATWNGLPPSAPPSTHHHRASIELIHQGMMLYLSKRPAGKAFHDPLAACCAINPDIGTWASVRMFREKGHWGAKLAEPDDPLAADIIIDYDHELFVKTLLGDGYTYE